MGRPSSVGDAPALSRTPRSLRVWPRRVASREANEGADLRRQVPRASDGRTAPERFVAAVVAAGEAADEEHAREETREKPWGHACRSFLRPPCGSFHTVVRSRLFDSYTTSMCRRFRLSFPTSFVPSVPFDRKKGHLPPLKFVPQARGDEGVRSPSGLSLRSCDACLVVCLFRPLRSPNMKHETLL